MRMRVPPDAVLAGVILKLNRAEHHLNQLDTSITKFLESNFYDLAADFDRQGRVVYRVTRVDPPDPRWSVLIGEVLYNLRSALDHLAYEVAVLRHGRPLPPALEKSSAFPIMRSGPEFRRRVKRGGRKGQPTNDSGWHKIRGMPRRAQTVVERLQPYHRRKHPKLERLLWLDNLCNIDKHRTLHVTSAHSARSRYRIHGTGVREIRKIEVFGRPFEPKAMVARITIVFGEGDVDVDLEVVPDVIFEQGVVKAGLYAGVLDVLYACRNVVCDVVIPLMPFFPADERIAAVAKGPAPSAK